MSKLDALYSKTISQEAAAERAFVRAFNRWQRLKKKRARLAKRLDNFIVLEVKPPPDPRDPNDQL